MTEGLSCLAWDGDRLLCLGGANGSLFLWNLQTVAQIVQVKVHAGMSTTPINLLCYQRIQL